MEHGSFVGDEEGEDGIPVNIHQIAASTIHFTVKRNQAYTVRVVDIMFVVRSSIESLDRLTVEKPSINGDPVLVSGGVFEVSVKTIGDANVLLVPGDQCSELRLAQELDLSIVIDERRSGGHRFVRRHERGRDFLVRIFVDEIHDLPGRQERATKVGHFLGRSRKERGANKIGGDLVSTAVTNTQIVGSDLELDCMLLPVFALLGVGDGFESPHEVRCIAGCDGLVDGVVSRLGRRLRQHLDEL